MPNVKCDNCGNIVFKYPSQMIYKKNYCSKRCQTEGRIKEELEKKKTL